MAPIYAGALQPKKKGELQDIAGALRINNEGTKDDLQARIKKYLDDNPSLEDDSRFAGLYGRRKRSVPPPSQAEKATFTKRTASRTLPPMPETPVAELRDVSTLLKNQGTPSSLPPLPESEPSLSIVQRISAKLPSGAKAKMTEIITTRFDHEKMSQSSSDMLVTTRTFLSSSRNIWTVTAVLDFLIILYSVVPWQYARLSYSPSSSYNSPLADYSVPYPPISTLQAPAFWSVILHWALPSLIIPSVVGTLVSFAPKTPANNYNQMPFDPLSASITRLAAQIAWAFPSPKAFISPSTHKLAVVAHGVYGLDVLGQRWRVLTAGISVMFAFAEAISKAPGLHAASSSVVTEEQTSISAPRLGASARKMIEEAGETSEVD